MLNKTDNYLRYLICPTQTYIWHTMHTSKINNYNNCSSFLSSSFSFIIHAYSFPTLCHLQPAQWHVIVSALCNYRNFTNVLPSTNVLALRTYYYLWSPYLAGQTIIFLPCYFFLSIFFYLSIRFFSSPNLSGRRLDVYHTLSWHIWCGPSANLECRCERCCTRLAANAGPKKSPKIAIWATSHNFVRLYLRN